MKYDKIRGDVYLFCTPTPVKNHDLHIWSWHSDRTRTVALSLSGTGWYSGHSIGSLHCDSHVRPANGAGGWMWSHALVPRRRTISDNQAISRATSSFSKCSVMRMSLKITPEVTCKQQIGWISCACHAVWFLKSGVGQRIRFRVPVQVTHYSSSAWQTHQAEERKVMPSIHVEMCSSEFRLELFTCCSSHIFKFWWTCILLIFFSIVIWVSSWTIRQGKLPDTLKYILQAQAPKPSTHGNVAQVNNQKLVDPHETPGHVAHLWHSVEPLRRLGWLFVLAFHRCVHWSSHCAGNGEVPFSANEFHPLRKRKAGAMPGNHSGNQNHGLEAIDKCFFLIGCTWESIACIGNESSVSCFENLWQIRSGPTLSSKFTFLGI